MITIDLNNYDDDSRAVFYGYVGDYDFGFCVTAEMTPRPGEKATFKILSNGSYWGGINEWRRYLASSVIRQLWLTDILTDEDGLEDDIATVLKTLRNKRVTKIIDGELICKNAA